MKKQLTGWIMLVCISVHSQAQSNTPCSAPECSQFDFWVGDWDLTYNDTVKASNHITKELANCVIYENFSDPSQAFSGRSWSVYNPKSQQWQQTWVDNQGGYIVLTGKFVNNEMVLYTESRTLQDGSKGRNRMTFYNITSSSFDWNWEVTKDDGKTWQVVWKIHYTRKKG